MQTKARPSISLTVFDQHSSLNLNPLALGCPCVAHCVSGRATTIGLINTIMTWHKRPEYPFLRSGASVFPPHTVRRPGNGASRMQIRRLALVFFSAIEFDSCHFCSQEKGAGGNYNVLRNHRPDLFPLSSSELINLPPFFLFCPSTYERQSPIKPLT